MVRSVEAIFRAFMIWIGCIFAFGIATEIDIRIGIGIGI